MTNEHTHAHTHTDRDILYSHMAQHSDIFFLLLTTCTSLRPVACPREEERKEGEIYQWRGEHDGREDGRGKRERKGGREPIERGAEADNETAARVKGPNVKKERKRKERESVDVETRLSLDFIA